MPAIADQVETLEHDHAAALAKIDALQSANAALTSANASLQRDNIALQLEVNDMKHFVDDTRAMADSLASSALDMLRASRRQVGSVEPTSKRATMEKSDGGVEKRDTQGTLCGRAQSLIAAGNVVSLGVAPGPSDLSLDTKIAALPDAWPGVDATAEEDEQDVGKANALSYQGDSGDENCVTRADGACVAESNCMHTIFSIGATRFKPVLVEDKLPIFLQRDTPFERANVLS